MKESGGRRLAGGLTHLPWHDVRLEAEVIWQSHCVSFRLSWNSWLRCCAMPNSESGASLTAEMENDSADAPGISRLTESWFAKCSISASASVCSWTWPWCA